MTEPSQIYKNVHDLIGMTETDLLDDILEKLSPIAAKMKNPILRREDSIDTIRIWVEEGYKYDPSVDEISAAKQVVREHCPQMWRFVTDESIEAIIRELLIAADKKRMEI